MLRGPGGFEWARDEGKCREAGLLMLTSVKIGAQLKPKNASLLQAILNAVEDDNYCTSAGLEGHLEQFECVVGHPAVLRALNSARGFTCSGRFRLISATKLVSSKALKASRPNPTNPRIVQQSKLHKLRGTCEQ